MTPLETLSGIGLPLVEANGYKAGGSWDTVKTPKGFEGTGNLNEDRIKQLEKGYGLDERVSGQIFSERQRAFALRLYSEMEKTEPLPSMGEHLHSWCPEFGQRVFAPFWPIFSGDSSLMDEGISAPINALLITRAVAEPTKPTLFGMGTDTANLAIIKLVDVMVFDTRIAMIVGTGSRISHRQKGSDAPRQFSSLARLAQIDLPRFIGLEKISSGSGLAGWVFDERFYPASDIEKIYPGEQPTRRIDRQKTFLSPNASFPKALTDIAAYLSGKISFLSSHPARWDKCFAPPVDHISRGLTVGKLFDAMTEVLTVNLGDQNPTGKVLEQIDDPTYKAIVIAAHGSGNAPFTIRRVCARAVDEGKLVYVTSRCLIGEVNASYGVSLLSINQDRRLNDPRIISGGRLSHASARAIAIRSILENLNSYQSQQLINSYAQARSLADK